jgi:5-methylcytosine-specific restriction enzyme A
LNQKNKWLNVIIPALNKLGGQATLEQIYQQIVDSNTIDLDTYTDWKAQIRKNIYLHSSDTDIFKHIPGSEYDLFFSVEGRGKGNWGLRSMRKSFTQDTPQDLEMFSPGKTYKRKDLHDRFGGNRRRGISYPKKHPLIFIFTGKSGENYGYKDGWQDETTYFYTGEGKVGDQVFKEGNKVLRDQVSLGKSLYLFEMSEKSSFCKLINQFNCTGYHFRKGKDKNGDFRELIVFELQLIPTPPIPLMEEGSFDEELGNKALEELRNIALNTPTIDMKNNRKESIRMIYIREAAIKKYALKRANGICESCGCKAPFTTFKDELFLEVHHLTRLSDGGLDHPLNVAAICPNCHRRAHYSKDYIEFNNKLKYVIKKREETFYDNRG